MPNPIKRKQTFGSVSVDHFSPPLTADAPKALNITLSFEERSSCTSGWGNCSAI